MMPITKIVFAFLGFWMYQKLIYYDKLFVNTQLRAAHILFAFTGLLWLPNNAPAWTIVPLILNSTRIELFNLTFHVNNTVYFLLHVLKNMPIALCFYWTHSHNHSGAYVVSILFMDLLSLILWELKTCHRKHIITKYLSIYTLKA